MNVEAFEKLRQRRGLTQREFAESFDFTVTGYQKMLRNQDAKISVLERISEVYDVDISLFFGKKEPKKVDAVNDPGAKYATDPCGGVRRENELLRSQVASLDSSNKALQQVVDLLQRMLQGAELKVPAQTKAHKHK